MKNILFALMFALVGCTATEDKGSTLLIGTYTDAGSRGIYRTTFSDEGFSTPELVVEVDNPSFLAL